MRAAVLEDRGVVEVAGLDAGPWLQRLVTNDVLGLREAEARYAALLTPQGKILVDFLIVAVGQGEDMRFLIDCPRAIAPDLARKLKLYRLRAKVDVVDRSADLGVAAAWPGPPVMEGVVYRDPRRDDLGYRAVAPRADLALRRDKGAAALYHEMRILAGVPEGGIDFVYGETFPHEANLDKIRGVDFAKGCYVGQEVVSRVEHRGTARKRVAAVSFEGAPPPPGTEVTVGDIVIGTMGSAVPGNGLAMIRLDRAGEAAALGAAVTCGGVKLMVALP